MTAFIDDFAQFVPLLGTIAAVIGVLAFINWFLRRRWHGNPDAQFRFQLIMLALSFAGLLAIIVALPINDALRGQLLSLIGILLSAAIALSSTTFIGNIMAGIMLKAVKNARPGDFITVADLTGRITEMDLLHTEIQTEFRDLVTVPNLYMVTQPLQVVRASGTIIQAEVSLGYDMNTRGLGKDQRFIPMRTRRSATQARPAAEEIAFDKAEDAASIEKIRNAIEQTDAALKSLGELGDEADPAERDALEEKKRGLIEQLKAGEEAIKAKELTEKHSGDEPG